jgi:O-antigen ligase
MLTKLEILGRIIIHKYWMAAILSGAFFSFFALNRGGIVVFIDAAFIFLVINVSSGRYRIRTIPAAYWVTCIICGYVLFGSILVTPYDSHYRWMKNVPRMLAIVFGMHYLYQKKIDTWITVLFAIVVVAAVGWQSTALHFFAKPAGTFTGLHQLAIIAVMAIPAIFYFFWITNGWYRYLLIIAGLIALDLLLRTHSRPALLGLTAGIVFSGLFLVKRRLRWILLAAVFLTLALFFVFNYADFADRIIAFFKSWRKEARIYMWAKAWQHLQDNSVLDWLFGHGIGRFEIIFPKWGKVVGVQVTPHNYVLHLIYASGLTGLILIAAGFAMLIRRVCIAARRGRDLNIRVLAGCLIVNFFSWLTLCGLNFSVYSKYSLYPLAYLLGPMLVVIQHENSETEPS